MTQQPWIPTHKITFTPDDGDPAVFLVMQEIHTGWRNNLYAVWVSTISTEWGPVDHLWIRRHDAQPIRSWRDMQRIKREVLFSGAERTAVEVYPAESDIVDSANMYHLWVMPVGFRLPFTLKSRDGVPRSADWARRVVAR